MSRQQEGSHKVSNPFPRGQQILGFVLLLIGLSSLTNAEPIDFGLKCRLPGWPGHPAPTCDPGVPEQCCPGTKCLPDPFDSEHSTCQQTQNISPSEHALTASVLTGHVESLMHDALASLQIASTSLYLSNMESQRMGNQDIVKRAQSLVQNHANKHPFSADASERHAKDWHGGHDEQVQDQGAAKGTPTVGGGVASTPAHQHQGSAPGGDFDYSKYYNGGGTGSDDGKAQGGFDYSKYMPKNIPNNGDDSKDKGKKGDKKPAENKKENSEGKGGYDYSPNYKSGGDPHKTGYTGRGSRSPTTVSTTNEGSGGSSGGGQGGFDYSQYWPMQGQGQSGSSNGNDAKSSPPGGPGDANGGQQGGFDYSQYWPGQGQTQGQATKHVTSIRASNVANEGNGDENDLLKKAALDLLAADVELKTSSAQAKKDVYERIKSILNDLNSLVDKELGDNSDGVARSSSNSASATKSPTLVWNDGNDFWSKYIPKIPSGGYGGNNQQGGYGGDKPQSAGGVQFNGGDRRPGSLGGPCGKTSYKDFGSCMSDMVCVGLTSQKPGICQMDRAATLSVSRASAVRALQVADRVSDSLRMAAMELLIGSSPRMDAEKVDKSKPDSSNDMTITINETSLDPREYSPATLGIVLLGFAVLGYFCWMNAGRRRSYQSLDRL